MNIRENIIGKRFGRLVVKNFKSKEGRGRYRVICKCDCGNMKEVFLYSLTTGYTKSCGCWNLEKIRERSTTHGQSKTSEYNTWILMRRRCNDKKDLFYSYYGGRGIKVCKRWQNSFENFYADMGPKLHGLSLDRINTNGHYTPKNCRWATRFQQSQNRDYVRNITFEGKTMCIAAWAREVSLPYKLLLRRLNQNWPVERALTEPKHG